MGQLQGYSSTDPHWHAIHENGRDFTREQHPISIFCDPVPRLPSRCLLSDQLGHAISAPKRSGCHGAMMFLDRDNFKSLNDRRGHEIGDLSLREVAWRLKVCVREQDTAL